MKKKDETGIVHMMISISFIILTGLIIILCFNDVLDLRALFVCWISVPIIVIGIAYFVYCRIKMKTSRESKYVILLICLAVAIISALIGVIVYINDHSFMMRGVEAQLIWVFVSLPLFVTALIFLMTDYIRYIKLKKNGNEEK